MVSSTLRAMGPSLSRDQQRVMAPVRGTRPKVGRRPVTPQRMEGLTMLPSVSLPMAKATSPAAVAAPGPALEPDEPSSSSQGFMVWPPNQMSLSASAPMLSLATSTAPASLRRSTTALFFVGTRSLIGLRAVGGGNAGGIQQVLRAPGNAVQRSAIMAGGNFGVGLAGLVESVFAREGDDAVQFGIKALDAANVDFSQARGGELAALDPARKLGDGCEGDVFFSGRKRGMGVGAAHEDVGGGLAGHDAGKRRDSTEWRARGRARARACAGRRGVRRAGAICMRQLPAAWARSAGVISI